MKSVRIRNALLAAALAKTGLTNKRLAELAAIHPVTVSNLLNKRFNPAPETAKAIARALRCATSDLFPEVTQ